MSLLAGALVLLLAPQGSGACDQARADLEQARQALRDCLATGAGCQREFEAVDHSESAAKPCADVSAPAPDPSPVPSPAVVVRLADPPLGGELVGAVLAVTATNGVIYQGRVVEADAAHLAIDIGVRRDFAARAISSIRTLHPIGVPVHAADRVVVDVEGGSRIEGVVEEVRDTGIVVIEEDKREEIRWSGILRVENLGHSPADTRLGRFGWTPGPIHEESPVFPASALGRNGVVVVEVTIDEQGSVAYAHVVHSDPPFDAAALEAARKWRYPPLALDGKRTVWQTTLTFRFEGKPGPPKKR